MHDGGANYGSSDPNSQVLKMEEDMEALIDQFQLYKRQPNWG